MTKVTELHPIKNYATECNEIIKNVAQGSGAAASILRVASRINHYGNADEVRTSMAALNATASTINMVTRAGIDFISELIKVELLNVTPHHCTSKITLMGQNQPSPLVTILVESTARSVDGNVYSPEVVTIDEITDEELSTLTGDTGSTKEAVQYTVLMLKESILGRRKTFMQVGELGENMLGFKITNDPIPSRYLINITVIVADDDTKPYDANNVVLKTF